METSELTRYRKALKHKEADLEKGNRSRAALAIETSPDELDRIQYGQERDLAMGTLDRDSRLLREVRTALSRIGDGRFGICLECEEDISTKRLAAVPWTALCIRCQEVADQVTAQPWAAADELLASAA